MKRELSFSERRGLKPVPSALQVDLMDDRLRQGLWNLLTVFYLHIDGPSRYLDGGSFDTYLKRLWVHQRWPLRDLHAMERWRPSVLRGLGAWFDDLTWNEVYDFVELTTRIFPNNTTNAQFREACNLLFEEEMSGYRFVGDVITEITSQEEIEAIEAAIDSTSGSPVQTHLQNSLRLLADRDDPDYRNSVK